MIPSTAVASINLTKCGDVKRLAVEVLHDEAGAVGRPSATIGSRWTGGGREHQRTRRPLIRSGAGSRRAPHPGGGRVPPIFREGDESDRKRILLRLDTNRLPPSNDPAPGEEGQGDREEQDEPSHRCHGNEYRSGLAGCQCGVWERITNCELRIKDKVEWKGLGEVGELVRGSGLPKVDFTETGVPAIHYGQIYTYYGVYTTKTISFVSKETAKKLKRVNNGDVVITNTSENLEDVGKAVVYLGEQQAVTRGHATIFKPKKILGKYFVYYTQTANFSKDKKKYAKGTKVIDVSATDMAKIKIPIPYKNGKPDLEKQKEIVEILDKFDALVNDISIGLPAEIKARCQQYEYYREKLLTFTPLDK